MTTNFDEPEGFYLARYSRETYFTGEPRPEYVTALKIDKWGKIYDCEFTLDACGRYLFETREQARKALNDLEHKTSLWIAHT